MGINREKLEAELAELDALFPNQGNSQESIRKEIPILPNRAELEAELAELENLYPTKEEVFIPKLGKIPRAPLGRRAKQLYRGILTEIGDVGESIGPGNRLYMPDGDYTDEQQMEFLGRKTPAPTQGQMMAEIAGLGQEYEPEQEDTLGKVLNFAGKMIAPSPFLGAGGYGNVVSSAVKGGTKAATKTLAKDIGMMGAQAAAIKGTPRFTEEGGIPGVIEDIVKGAGTSAGLSSAGRKASSALNSNAKSLSRIEKSVSDYLIDKVGVENVDQVLDNLREYRSSIGYKPLTAEIAENDSLAQLYRAQKGIAGSGIDEQQALNSDIIKSALKHSKKGSDDIAHTQEYIRDRTSGLEGNIESELRAMRPTSNVTDTGRTLQDTLIKNLKEKEKFRRDLTAPMYESLDKNISEINLTNTLDVLNNTNVKGKIKNDFDYIKNQIMPKNLSKKDITYKKWYDKQLDSVKEWGEEAKEQVKNSMKVPKSINPTVAEVSAVRRGVINTMLDEFESSGQKTRAAMVRKVKEALDKDLQVVPEQKAADFLFKKLSEPVSEITENKALRSVTKERYGSPVMSSSRVPGTFINSSAGSIDDSRSLFNQIKDNPEAMKVVKEYLNEKAMAYIIDPSTGKVDLKKIESFKEKYPGAKILYPELYNLKLKNLSNAQVNVNKFIDKTKSIQKTLERDAFGELAGGDPKNIMPEIFSKHSTGNMKSLLSEISQDKSGKSLNGLKNETIDYFEKSISNRSKVGKNHVLSYDKMKKFMDNHEKALHEVLDTNQMSVIKEIEKIVEGQNSAATRGLAPGSPTNANIRNALSLSNWSTGAIKASLTKLGVSIPGISEFIKNFADARLANKESVLNRALRDTEYAAFLMSTPLKSKKDAIEFSTRLKKFNNSRYLIPEIIDLIKSDNSTE